MPQSYDGTKLTIGLVGWHRIRAPSDAAPGASIDPSSSRTSPDLDVTVGLYDTMARKYL